MLGRTIKFISIFLLICVVCSCSSYKNEKRDYWLKHQYRALSYIDTSKLNSKATSFVIDGAIAKQKGNHAFAIVNYMLALKYDTTAALLFGISEGFFWLGEYKLAIEYAHQALNKDPNFLPCYELLCRSYLYSNDIINATIAMECAIKIEENEDILLYLGGLYEYQKSFEKAKDIYRKLVNQYSNNTAMQQLVNIERIHLNYDVAGNILYNAWKKHPDDFKISMELINNWFIENKIDSIVNNLDNFDDNFSIDDLETMYNYIIMRLDTNKNNYEKIINKIDNRFNSSQILNYSAGNYAIKNNDINRAKIFFDNIINNPNTPIGIISNTDRILANMYYNMKEYSLSDSIYEKIIQEDADHIAFNNYAYSLSTRGVNLEKALELSKKSLEYVPNSPEYLDTYGWIHYKMGDYNKALNYLYQSLEYDNKNSEVYLHLADIYIGLNNNLSALKIIESAIEISPNNSELIQKKIEIESLIQLENEN